MPPACITAPNTPKYQKDSRPFPSATMSHQCSGGDQRARSDASAVEDDGAHPDERVVLDLAAVQNGVVAHADARTHPDGELRVDVDGDAVLDVGAEPRNVAPYQTLALAASVTCPMMLALGATQLSACNSGARPRMGMISGSGMAAIVCICSSQTRQSTRLHATTLLQLTAKACTVPCHDDRAVDDQGRAVHG